MHRRTVSLLSVFSLVVVAAGVLDLPAAHATTTVQPASAASTMANATSAYWSYAATRSVAVGWTGNAASCVPGKPSAAHQTATFQALNYFRKMTGLSTVSENTTLSAQAQQAALMFEANNSLSHTPPSTWSCYTAAGASSAGMSNAALGFPNGPTAISAFVNDSDVSNSPSVGHRQWILDPLLSTFGSGTTNKADALQFGGATTNTSNLNPDIIAWPPAGYFPYEMTYDKPGTNYASMSLTAWSVQSMLGTFSASNTVTITRNGTAVTHGAVTTTTGFGHTRALIWQMPVIAKPAAGKVDVYKVTISGITGLSDTTYTYNVNVFNAGDVAISSVTISGTARFGQTLTATTTGVSPSSAVLSYQWYRNGSAISGATGKTYTVVAADVNASLTVKVTGNATQPGLTYTPATVTSSAVVVQAATMTASAVLPASVTFGGKLTVNTAGWTPTGVTFTYQWSIGTSAISGATGATYTPAVADIGKTVTVKVTGTKAGYTTASASASTAVQIGAMTPKVTMASSAQTGVALKADTSGWVPTGTTFTYVWSVGGVVVSGASGASYTPTTADLGKVVTVKVTGTKSGYTTASVTSSTSAVVGRFTTVPTPTVSGSPSVGNTLTANAGTWSPTPSSLTYQWTSNGVAISGATHQTYVVTAPDVGTTIAVTVTGSKSGYATVSATSAAVTASASCGFADVPSTNQYAGYVCWMKGTGVTTGTTPTTFSPAANVTRGQMAAFMYRLAGSPTFTAPKTASFSDVPTSNEFYMQIEWLKSTGITTGTTPTTFSPAANVTRGQMAAFMYRLAGSPTFTAPKTASFSDVPTSNEFYKQIEWLKHTAITTGTTPTTYSPAANVTRQQMAAFMYRLAQKGYYCKGYPKGVGC